MAYYAIKVEAWPYSTGAGADADKAAVGPEVRIFRVAADTWREACRLADAIQQGILSHDKVWEAPIRSVDYIGTRP